MGCDSIHDRDTCLSSLDGRYSPASPCVWCSGASNCGGNDCRPQGLVGFEVEDTQAITCQALRCPQNFPICDHGDCIIQACSSGECSWSEGDNFISGYDEKGTTCGGDYKITQPPTYSPPTYAPPTYSPPTYRPVYSPPPAPRHQEDLIDHALLGTPTAWLLALSAALACAPGAIQS